MLDRCSPARMHFHPPSSPSPSFFGFQNKICFRRGCVYKMSIQIKFCRCRCRVEFNVDSWELPVLDSFVLWIMAHFMYRFLKTHNFNCRFSQFYILFPPFVLLIAKPFFSTSDCLLKIVIIPTNQLLNIIWDSLNRTITSKVQIYFSKFCETFESKGFFTVCVFYKFPFFFPLQINETIVPFLNIKFTWNSDRWHFCLSLFLSGTFVAIGFSI